VEALIDDLSTDVNADDDSSAHDTPFRKISSGTCAASGAMPIKSASLCTKAAAALGLSGASIRTTAATPRPEGCYWFNNAELWMSTGNVGNGYDAVGGRTREPICTTIEKPLRAAPARKKAVGKKKAAGEWANVMKWFVHHHTKPQCSAGDKGCICMASGNPKYADFCCRAGIELGKFTWEFFVWGIRTGRSHQMLTNGWFTKRGLVLYIHEVLAVYKCYSQKQTIYNLKHADRQIKDGLKSILKILHPFGDMDSDLQAATQEIDDQGVSAEDLSIKKTAADAGRADAHPLQSLLQYSGAGANCGAWEME